MAGHQEKVSGMIESETLEKTVEGEVLKFQNMAVGTSEPVKEVNEQQRSVFTYVETHHGGRGGRQSKDDRRSEHGGDRGGLVGGLGDEWSEGRGSGRGRGRRGNGRGRGRDGHKEEQERSEDKTFADTENDSNVVKASGEEGTTDQGRGSGRGRGRRGGQGGGRDGGRRGRIEDHFVECPHCGGLVQILAVKCGIFRHGVFKSTGRQLKPHEKRERCESLVAQGLIEGCGKPFQISKEDHSVSICDYI